MKKLLLSATVVAMSAASAFAMDAPSQLYLIGAYEGGGWDPEVGLAMDEYEDGVFYVEDVYMNEGTSYFAFTSQLGSWDDVNAGRVAPTEKDAEFLVDEGNAFVYGVDASWAIPEGTYDFYVNFNTGVAATTYEATLDEVVTPEPGPGPVETWSVWFENSENWETVYVYVWDGADAGSWPGAEMTYNEDMGLWHYQGVGMPANIIFNNGDGVQTADLEFQNGATYDFEGVDEEATQGVSTIKADLKGADVIYNLNGVRVNSNNLTPGIYVINGKKVAIK